MSMNTSEITSNKTSTILSATGTGAGNTYKQAALKIKFSAESDGSHTGTTTVDIESKVGSLWEWVGTLTVTGNSDSDAFNSAGVLGEYRANVTAHGDSTNTVTVRTEV